MEHAKKALIKKDPTLKSLFKRHHPLDFKPKLQRSPYESLVRAIAHQQLHGKAAETILGRMIALFPDQKFPTPEQLVSVPFEKLRSCGFSQNKVKSIKDIAQKTLDGIVPDKKAIKKMTNEEIVERLTEIYGVGRWTVEMLLIFQLGRLDIWPIDDFGVRNGFRIWKKKKAMPTAKEIKPHGEKWSPFETVVALHLWREADFSKKK
jgi:DNA-3-methyladenine glycosylase II